MLDKAIKELHHRRNQLLKEIQSLEAEGKKLGHAIQALTRLSGVKAAVKAVKKQKRKISAAGRKAIAAAQKARWAKIKAAKKK